MAFTLSHAIVAPLIYRVTKGYLPMASLAIGAMAPDIAGQLTHQREFAHTFTGLFTLDLLFGIIVCLLWYNLYRPCVYYWCHRKIKTYRKSGFDLMFYTLVGLILGEITHLLWDSFTHDEDPIFLSQAVLEHPIQIPFSNMQMKLDLFLQYSTSIIALPFLYFLIRPFLKSQKNNSSDYSYRMLIKVWSISTLFSLIYASCHTNQFLPFLHGDIYFFFRGLYIQLAFGFMFMFSLFCLYCHWQNKDQLQNLACDDAHNKA